MLVTRKKIVYEAYNPTNKTIKVMSWIVEPGATVCGVQSSLIEALRIKGCKIYSTEIEEQVSVSRDATLKMPPKRLSVTPVSFEPNTGTGDKSHPVVCVLPAAINSMRPAGVERYVMGLKQFLNFPQTSCNTEADIVHWNPWAKVQEVDVATSHGLYLEEDWPPSASPNQVEQNNELLGIYRNCKQVITVSKWFTSVIKERYGIDALHISNAVDVNEYSCQEYGDYVLWIGNNSHIKRSQDVVELAKLTPNIKYVAVGIDTGNRNQFPYMNISTFGYVSHTQIKAMLSKCKFLLMTSSRDQCPTVVFEALASGKPVLAWDHFAGRDLVLPGKTGYLATPYDYNELTKYADRLYTEAPEMGPACLDDVKQYDWRNIVKKIEDVYLDCYKLPISVVILAFNNRDTLRKAIDSLERRCEVIVGDADGTHRDLVPDWCKYIRLPNKSLGDNRARAFALATQKYHCVLDGDDTRILSSLIEQMEYLEANPKTGVVFGGAALGDGKEQWFNKRPTRLSRENFVRCNPIPNGATLWRSEAYKSVGGFADMAYCEDYDFYWRVYDAGWEIDFIPILCYNYNTNQNSISAKMAKDGRMRATIRETIDRGKKRLKEGKVVLR